MRMKGVTAMPDRETSAKKPVNLSLSEALVQESRAYCGNLSAKVEEMLQDYVITQRQARQTHRQQAQQAVADWNSLHDASGSYADGHSTLQGLTVQYLFHRTVALKAGDTVLFHAAAGGVGLIACQWARVLGVNLIGTVGSEEKAALAIENGAAHVINYNQENFTEKVRELTGGKGVSVVYDSIGKDTFFGSLDCLAPLGTMVSFGNASGPVPPFSLNELQSRGSLFVTRPTLMSYAAKREDLEAMAKSLFGVVSSGEVKIAVKQRYNLADVAQAHIDLESRKTTGDMNQEDHASADDGNPKFGRLLAVLVGEVNDHMANLIVAQLLFLE
eukprot:gene10675-12460_t